MTFVRARFSGVRKKATPAFQQESAQTGVVFAEIERLRTPTADRRRSRRRPTRLPRTPRGLDRRLDPKEVAEFRARLETYALPKTPNEATRIEAMTRANYLFLTLAPEKLRQVVSVMRREEFSAGDVLLSGRGLRRRGGGGAPSRDDIPVRLSRRTRVRGLVPGIRRGARFPNNPRQVLMRAGDEGDKFYLVDSGAYDVVIRDASSGVAQTVHTYRRPARREICGRRAPSSSALPRSSRRRNWPRRRGDAAAAG